MRAIDWDAGATAVAVLDQTRLPGEVVVGRVTTTADLVRDIRRLAVRGAPALGVAGALGVALAAHRGEDVEDAAAALRASRPTAVNLGWGVDRALAAWRDGGAEAALACALQLAEDDAAADRAIGERGADLLEELLGRSPRRMLTHCNTGALACVEWGTALGIVRSVHARAPLELVYTCETRPLLQGARLTAWELGQAGIPHRLIVDSAAAGLLARGAADAVVVGADRIAANGDVANKVGTLSLALAARHAGVPFLVAAPESTVDPATPDGDAIAIEERSGDEVTSFAGTRTAPEETQAANPAFDVTPAALITAIVTESRTVQGPAA